MSFMYEFVEVRKPESKTTWLTKEQKLDFESTYFDDKECALDALDELVTQNGLNKDLIEMSDNGRSEMPFEISETDYNPMVEAMANWNEYINSND